MNTPSSEKKKSKIIISTPSYRPWSGGVMVLHLLAKLLVESGWEVEFHKRGAKHLPFWNPYNIKLAKSCAPDDIMVYPQAVRKNQFKAKRIVRYVMGPTLFRNGFKLFIAEKWRQVAEDRGFDAPNNILFIIDSKHDFFVDQGRERSGSCYTLRKAKKLLEKRGFKKPEDMTEIHRGTRDKELLEIFNTHERFYCYDQHSFLSIQAALCGCDSIIVPMEGISRKLAIESRPGCCTFGIAYGEEELPYARNTRHILKPWFEHYEKTQKILVKAMFEKIEEEI